MQLHELKSTKKRASAKRVGRGGKRGKTSGRGHKGQKARAGNSTVPQIRETIKKLPKLRGHGVNRAKTVDADTMPAVVVNVAQLETAFADGAKINPKALVAAGVIRGARKRAPAVKILGSGVVTKKFTVTACYISTSAKNKIEKAGGSIS